jgi:hypothetical protein
MFLSDQLDPSALPVRQPTATAEPDVGGVLPLGQRATGFSPD